ncbi:hypothetical protein GOP47_0029179 [Adiantum capillus-veneris]|nr:hypothetical protein GOP47_0029179 [Adiantum capillus-veneris]
MDTSHTHVTEASRASPLVSEESALVDHDVHPSSTEDKQPMQSWQENLSIPPVAPSGQHAERSAAYFRWPPLSRAHGTAEERAAYFSGLQKDVVVENKERGQQATTLLDLMTIRAFHSKELRRYSLGTALGFRTRGGLVTDIPAIIVFVARKVHKQWLHHLQRLPPVLEGPGGIWCDVDVVEFSYCAASAVAPKEQVYTELVEGLQGNDPHIGPGSQVASQETYGTLGAIVQSRIGLRQVGFLTNRHVAVDLDYPNQKMFHPLPPMLGPGVYLGAVERATSFITDDLWYNIFASMNPETFVRADGAFIPFGECFDISRVKTSVEGVGEMGDVVDLDLQAPVGSIVGKQVVKVGRSSGVTTGSIMAYALEYNDEKGICFFTDFLIVGENGQAFDLEGDSGSLILIVDGEGQTKPTPVGIIWGGTANRGRLKLRHGCGPENWTSGVDLGRLLDLLQLTVIKSSDELTGAIGEQRQWLARLVTRQRVEEKPIGCHGGFTELGKERASHPVTCKEFSLENLHTLKQQQESEATEIDKTLVEEPYVSELPSTSATVELELLDFAFARCDSQPAQTSHAIINNDGPSEDLSFGLQLFDRHAKKRRPSDS